LVLKMLIGHYIRSGYFFSQNRQIWVSIDPYFSADFKKLNFFPSK
jgi:hypothetical protein